MEVDIHNSEHNLKRRIEMIRKSEQICQENKEDMLRFSEYCFAEGLGKPRVLKYLYHLQFLATWLRKPFRSATKDDAVTLVAEIERKDLSDWSKHDYKMALKKFFKWLRNSEDYLEEVKWLKIKVVRSRLPEVLTNQEVTSMAEAADNPRDRALVLTLFESGCRIGELLPLKIKDVQFDKYGAVLLVYGKTGSIRKRIISSAPALANWLNVHPFKNEKEAFVWIVMGSKHHYGLVGYNSVRMILNKLAKRTGIQKRIYPHLFRHSSATELSNYLTESQLKEHFGWGQRSKMASIYVHLSGRNVDDALLKLHGIQTDERTAGRIRELNCNSSSFGGCIYLRCVVADYSDRYLSVFHSVIESQSHRNYRGSWDRLSPWNYVERSDVSFDC
jgi:site-specific recombinase XerD